GMHAILAALMAAVYGIPIFYITAKKGIPMPEIIDEMGFSAALKLFPAYSAKLVIGTVLVVLAAATIVSFLPARKISKMIPTDAIRGKIQ
ncbi:MAG: ABC transporter permease, partial [Deltaproteobacteria bacterium]|nr:ABC transporter permease [Deltaproteobacteria bacterium]